MPQGYYHFTPVENYVEDKRRDEKDIFLDARKYRELIEQWDREDLSRTIAHGAGRSE